MKVALGMTVALLSVHQLGAQQPPLAGNWRVGQQRVFYQRMDDDRFFAMATSDEVEVDFFSDHRLTTGPDTGRWIFSNGYLLAVQAAQIDTLALNESGSVFFFASSNIDGPLANFSGEANFRVAIKTATEAPTIPEMVGSWTLFRQKLEFVESSAGGSSNVSLSEVNHNRIDVTLLANGTFQGENITDTESPANEGQAITGTWNVAGGALSITTGGETSLRPHISAGADFILHTKEEQVTTGEETFFSTELEIWVKRTTTLTAQDLFGRWGLSGATTELLQSGGGNPPSLREAGTQQSEVVFRPDGTGLITEIQSGNNSDTARRQPFTWSIDGQEFSLSADGGSFSFVVSEKKDVSILLNANIDPGSGAERYNLFALSKLPNAPGFAAQSRNGTFELPEIPPGDISLEIQSVNGIPYQVEESSDLATWITRTPPILGTGEEITSSFSPFPAPRRFFRWRILPLNDAP